MLGFAWGMNDRHFDGAVGKQSVVGGDKLCASPWHAPYHFSRRPAMEQTLCIIRHPVDRLISEFNYHAAGDKCSEANLDDWVQARAFYLPAPF